MEYSVWKQRDGSDVELVADWTWDLDDAMEVLEQHIIERCDNCAGTIAGGNDDEDYFWWVEERDGPEERQLAFREYMEEEHGRWKKEERLLGGGW